MISQTLVRRNRGLWLVVLFLASCASGVACAAPILPEDLIPQLGEVLRDALRQSPRMVLQNLRRLEAEQSILVSSAPLYPHVNFSFVYNAALENRGDSGADYPWNTTSRHNAFLTVAQPLWNWGALEAGAEIGRIQAQIAANNVREAYRLLALDIRSAFLQLVIDRASVRAARFSEDLVRRRLGVVQARVASGELPIGGDGPTQMVLNEAAFAAERSNAMFERNLVAFRRLVGKADFPAESIPAEIPDIPRIPASEIISLNGDFVGRLTLDGRYETVLSQVQQQRLDLHIAKVAQRPTVSLQSGYSEDQLTYVTSLGQRTGIQSFYVGLSVNWNLFDGRATRGRILASRTRLQQMENQLASLEEDLRIASEQSGSDLHFAAQSLKFAEDRFGATLAGFNLTEENVGRQRASQDDLEEVRGRLNSAELGMFAARAGYLNALAAWLQRVDADPIVPPSLAAPVRP